MFVTYFGNKVRPAPCALRSVPYSGTKLRLSCALRSVPYFGTKVRLSCALRPAPCARCPVSCTLSSRLEWPQHQDMCMQKRNQPFFQH